MSNEALEFDKIKLLVFDFPAPTWVEYSLKGLLGTGLTCSVCEASPVKKSSLKKLRAKSGLEPLEPIALKLINGNYEEHMVAEFFLLPRLNHPGIPKLIGCRWYPKYKTWGFGISLAQGGDMMTWSQSKQVSEQELARVIYQLLDIVDFVHKYGYIHRDINLENIL